MRRLVLCIAGFVVVSTAWAAEANDVIARMGSVELRRADVQGLAEAQGIDLKGEPQQAALALEQLVRTELVRRHVLAEARREQWDARAEVRAQIERARDQVVVASYMNHVARPPANYPSDDELKTAYEANKVRFTTPPQYRVAQIYISGGTDLSAAERKADEAQKQATARSADFAAVARSLSEHKASADKGGEVGWLSEDQLLPEFRPVLQALSVGQVSKPVKSPSGVHVFKLLERKPSGVRPLAEVREALAGLMRLQRAQEAEREYMNKLAAKHPAVVNGIALTGLIQSAKP